MRASEFLATEIMKLINNARDQRGPVLESNDPEAVHDFRVYLRRLRSVTRTIRGVYDRFQVDYIRRGLKVMASATAELRDQEVLVETLNEVLPEDAGESPRQYIQAQDHLASVLRDEFRRRLRDDPEYILPLREMEALMLLPVPPRKDVEFSTFAYKTTRNTVKKLEKELPRLTKYHDQPNRLHDLRITCKHVRYVINFYGQEKFGKAAKFARKLQNELGLVHDCDFILERLARDAREEPENSRLLAELIAGRRRELMRDLAGLSRTARKHVRG